MPSTLAPTHLDAGRHAVLSRFRHPSCDGGCIVQGLLDGPLPGPPYLVGYCRWDGRFGRMTPPNNHTCDFMSQPLVPPTRGNNYPSLPEHVPKISTGQCLLHPGINPWLPLRSGFIWRTIAPIHP